MGTAVELVVDGYSHFLRDSTHLVAQGNLDFPTFCGRCGCGYAASAN